MCQCNEPKRKRTGSMTHKQVQIAATGPVREKNRLPKYHDVVNKTKTPKMAKFKQKVCPEK